MIHPYQVPPNVQIALEDYQRCFAEYREALKDNSDRVLTFQKYGELQAAWLRLFEACKGRRGCRIEDEESVKDAFMEFVHKVRGHPGLLHGLE